MWQAFLSLGNFSSHFYYYKFEFISIKDFLKGQCGFALLRNMYIFVLFSLLVLSSNSDTNKNIKPVVKVDLEAMRTV